MTPNQLPTGDGSFWAELPIRDGSSWAVPTIALAGNPNVGKSTIFNALTHLRQHTGNWPGKTVEAAEGFFRHRGRQFRLVDLPGTYSLLPHSPEEEATRDFLRSGAADAAVVVCDATCLERSLALVLQMSALVPNTIVCVNLMDEAAKKGITIDLPALSRQLGVTVIGTAAQKKRSLTPLMDAIATQLPIRDGSLWAELPIGDGSSWAVPRWDDAEAIAARVVTTRGDPHRRDRRLDRVFTGRLTGIPVMLLLLVFVLWLTMAGANAPSQWLAARFDRIGASLSALLAAARTPAWLHSALIDGIWRVLAWVVAVMLPPMGKFK